MFLKALSIKGFKSFADATTLEFEPGVTVVVGPNGSGKSNVVDAIAWVLGAQAPSAVRSQKMDDVIFAGTASRAALGRAEVSLTIDNSAGLLGLDFTEVTVRRTLFRSGDSDYAINNVPCRLLDVQELLSDAGVGRQQHVIVSQGQIDAVLNARPEERRGIIEEAAGVLKYRRRKEKAERRLDATEANLLRLQDLLREVRRQLRPLERQAEAARRHGDLVEELSGLRVYVAGREIAGLRTKLTTLAVTRNESSTEETRLKAELARLDAEVVALGAELTARGADDVSDRLARADQLRERARGLAAVMAERTRGLERDRGQLLDEGLVATLVAEAARYRTELAEVATEQTSIEPEVAELEGAESSYDAERTEALEIVEPLTTASASSALAEVRGELRSRKAAAERAETDLVRSRSRRDELTARVDELDRLRDRHREECNQAESLEGPLIADIEQAEASVIAADAVHVAAMAHRQQSAEQTSSAAARAEALQLALDSAHARAGADQLAGEDGVLGTLLDLVRIAPGWEVAVEAALGEALNAVVVDDRATAARALRALHAHDTAGAVLALGASQPAGPAPEIGQPVRPQVSADRVDVERLLDVLLARAVRVDGLDAALDAVVGAAPSDPTLVVVTDDGDRFGASGWRVGAAAAGGVTAAALADATERRVAAEAALATAVLRVDESAAALRLAQQAEVEVANELDANDAHFTAASESLARVQAERRERHGEMEPLALRIEELNAAADAERSRIGELDALLPGLQAGESAEVDAARRREDVRSRLDARATVLAGRRRDLEVRAAGLRERNEFLQRRLDETERRLTADTAAREQAESRRAVVDRSLSALGRLSAFVADRRRVVDAHHAEMSERRQRQTEQVRALTAHLDAQRAERAANEKALDAVRERARRAELDEAEARLRLESAVELLRHDLDVEPEAAEAAEAPPLPDGVSAAARTRELERELRMLGPINPLALEEFTELQQRHTFLDGQLDDVRNTRRELGRVIKAVDQEIQTVFAEAYADVSTHFATLFGGLFPGGVGRLQLTQPDDLLNTGIEVEAKPGGKNVKKLSLLSGGERSLTALAFLFAVFRSRPSPFYVMDEVEAALDDVNLHRFLGLIAEFRSEAQLIVVSHQKRTMEAGDCLFGVTMQPGGSSKVIAERVAV